MPDKLLLLVHAILGMKKLEGFYQKDLARKLRISKPLLSQYLRGDFEIPSDVRDKIIKILEIEKTVEKMGLRFDEKQNI